MDSLTIILTSSIILLIINPVTAFLIGFYKFLINMCNCYRVNLKEKYGDWAVVTGATDGVGKAYAKELAKRDINVVLISRTLEKLIATQEEISKINPNIQVRIIQADFSRRDNDLRDIEHQLDDIPVGILVNNVARLTAYPMYFGEIPRKDLWDMTNVNVGATTVMTHMVIERMKERGRGAIVFVSSLTSVGPVPLFSLYAATKVLLRSLSDAIRIEYSKYGITVQCLVPFFISTNMVKYSERTKNSSLASPDASTYARHAIATLGKLDVTTGYWFHDIARFCLLVCPIWLRSRIGYVMNLVMRNDYLKSQRNVC